MAGGLGVQDSVTLRIGEVRLGVAVQDNPALVHELLTHINRVTGSRGEVIDAINQKFGPVTLAPSYTPGDTSVELTVLDGDGNRRPIAGDNMIPGDSNEIALSYILARLACRGLVSLHEVKNAHPLPNGRQLIDMRPVRVALVPQSVHLALGQLHTIGFDGMPEGPSRGTLRIGKLRLPTYQPNGAAVAMEVDELVRRLFEKFQLARGGEERFGSSTFRISVSDEDPSEVVIESEHLEPGQPDNILLEWAIINLLRPRKPDFFSPMRPMVLIPKDISSAPPLDDGRFLADMPSLRNQLMPAKVAQLLEDTHRCGGYVDSRHRIPDGISLKFGPLRLRTAEHDMGVLMARAQHLIETVRRLFQSGTGGEGKYGEVTLDVFEHNANTLQFKSAQFRPGCPDEIICEYVVARLLRDDVIPLDEVRGARNIGGRSLLVSPAVTYQLQPEGTSDLLDAVHTGNYGMDRRGSGWKLQV